jgi:hypothetical protein
MLARVEEAVHARESFQVTPGTTAMDAMLAGLIDYAGLYPPASLPMRTAVENHRTYRSGKHRNALGRFIVDLSRIGEFRAAAGSLLDLKLSVILAQPGLVHQLLDRLDEGLPIESVECKAASPRDVEQLTRDLPAQIKAYVEIPVEPIQPEVLRAISHAGARVKLRMGGVVAEAFPSTAAVARMLAVLSQAQLCFKATAGLHHPFRSRHPFTYAQDSPAGFMHGFVNMLCAAALIHSGAEVAEAARVLEEQDPQAWTLTPEMLAWSTHSWSPDRLCEIRKMFVSFGSCSFEEPIRDLEALGWL